MPFAHLSVTLLLVIIWGLNFVIIQVALQEIPPIMLTFLRFFFAAFPAVFFIKPPKTSWKMLLYYSLTLIVLDFCFLFTGMYIGVSAGMASLTLQTQVFFTAILAMVFLKERMSKAQILGSSIAFLGIVYVGFHTGGDVSQPTARRSAASHRQPERGDTRPDRAGMAGDAAPRHHDTNVFQSATYQREFRCSG